MLRYALFIRYMELSFVFNFLLFRFKTLVPQSAYN